MVEKSEYATKYVIRERGFTTALKQTQSRTFNVAIQNSNIHVHMCSWLEFNHNTTYISILHDSEINNDTSLL